MRRFRQLLQRCHDAVKNNEDIPLLLFAVNPSQIYLRIENLDSDVTENGLYKLKVEVGVYFGLRIFHFYASID